MEVYALDHIMKRLDGLSQAETQILVILTSDELVHTRSLPGLETVLHHTPLARDVMDCKAEGRRDCLCGTVFTPRHTKEGERIAFGYLLTKTHLVLCDDCGVIRSAVKRLAQERQRQENGPGRFFYELLDFLLIKDPHHLEELEDRLGQLEDQILAGDLNHFGVLLTSMRKKTMAWFRYYSQLGVMISELEEEENGFFSSSERRLMHMLEKRLKRLRDESQLLREYCLQIRELFQAEVDIRQNRIMKILTVVTTLCLPLSLVAGWYGMNFKGMPELSWKYGYPAVIVISLVIVAFCLWIMKKKKFW